MNRILCPVDFSDASLSALEFAAKIAEKHASSIKLVHVITPGEYNKRLKESGDRTYQAIQREIEAKLKVLSDEVNENSERDYSLCNYEILSGNLTEKLVEVSRKEGMAMVIMGTYGAIDINEARMGSNTVKVIDSSHIPVLSIPAETTFKNFNRIVYGSELSDDDKFFLQQVINFALPFNSRIYLVHVADPHEKDNEVYKKYTQEIKSYFNYKKLSFEEFVTSEKVSIALEHTLNVHDAQLLVLVHKSRNFLENLFHRSLTRKMSYLTNFPLLALRN